MVARACVLLALLVNLSVSRPDIDRALALARWPHTAVERTRFHDAYFVFAATAGLGEFRTVVLQIEVVTEFRRVELLAEAHQQLNDNFGRGGTDEVLRVMRPWRGKVAIDVHLQLPDQNDPIPATEIAISGVGASPARQVSRAVAFARSSFPSSGSRATWSSRSSTPRPLARPRVRSTSSLPAASSRARPSIFRSSNGRLSGPT